MSIQIYAAIFIFLNLSIIVSVYGILSYRRRNGKSDIRESRIAFVIACFAVPIVATLLFVIAALIAQGVYNYPIPVGRRGGGVFIILITSVISSVLCLLVLLPRIKHKWDD